MIKGSLRLICESHFRAWYISCFSPNVPLALDGYLLIFIYDIKLIILYRITNWYLRSKLKTRAILLLKLIPDLLLKHSTIPRII